VSPFKTHDHSIDSGGLGIYEVKIVIHPDEHQIEDNRCVLYKKLYTIYLIWDSLEVGKNLTHNKPGIKVSKQINVLICCEVDFAK